MKSKKPYLVCKLSRTIQDTPFSHSGLAERVIARSSPGSSTGIWDHFGPRLPLSLLGSVAPDVLPFCQHHYSADKRQSLSVQYGAYSLPATENGQCIAVPLWHADPVTRPATVWIFPACEHSMDTRVWVVIPCVSNVVLMRRECFTYKMCWLVSRAVVWALKQFWHWWMPRPLLRLMLCRWTETRQWKCRWKSASSKYVNVINFCACCNVSFMPVIRYADFVTCVYKFYHLIVVFKI